MKRYILLLMSLSILLGMCGCNKVQDTEITVPEHVPTTQAKTPIIDATSTQQTDMPVVTHPVTEKHYPQMPDLWVANCEEYILLRKNADGSGGLARILAGEQMQLLGWEGLYARVRYKGMEGYVMSCYIAPEDPFALEDSLDTIRVTSVYSYEQMNHDIERLKRKYPETVSTQVIGYSENGLPIPVLRIGNLAAKKHILLQGAIHGREHMTAWLLMAMADYWLAKNILLYGDVCIHIIPMSNPDGVIISQSGQLDETQSDIYAADRRKGYTNPGISAYAAAWKANALGVDINRNFPCGWYPSQMRKSPSSQRYGGTEPFSSSEAKALRDYTLQYSFDTTISYHSSGSVIYYEFGYKQPVNDDSEALALAVKDVTGYPLEGSAGVDGAGYKDWAIDELQIPSLTIEIGCKDSPLAEGEIYSIFARNISVLPTIITWLETK